MRGIGTVYVGLVLMVGLVALTVYIVHVYNVGLEAMREQQLLYERARFIAEHTSISGNTISLPQPADLIVVDPSGVPHLAKSVQRLQLPWPASETKIYVAVTGRLRVGAADPAATALSMAASVAAAPLQGNSSLTGGVYDCSTYLDPLLFNLTGSDYYRGYIPASVKNVTVKTYIAYPDDGPPPGWQTVAQGLGLPTSWPITGYILAVVVAPNDTATIVAYDDTSINTILRIYRNNTLITSATVEDGAAKNITIPGGWLWFYSNPFPWLEARLHIVLGKVVIDTHTYLAGYATTEIETTITYVPQQLTAAYMGNNITVVPGGGVTTNTLPRGWVLVETPLHMELDNEGATWDKYPTSQQIILHIHAVTYSRCSP